jgi:TIR domain
VAREVFVSYSQPDYACAMELVTRVESEGIDCWVAPRDIAPSSDWAAEIIDAISNARVMLLIFSASSNDSPQVRREVERAVHKNVNILPFRIEAVMPSKSLEYFLSSQHWMDAFPPPREAHYLRLCSYLKNQLSKAVPSSSASPDIASTQPAPILTKPSPWDGAQVARLERLLAGYIGPIARHLVKAAAARASSLDEVVAQLAKELESETERHEFNRRWRDGEPRAR